MKSPLTEKPASQQKVKVRPPASDGGALARVEVRRIDDVVQLEVAGITPEAVVLVQQFVAALHGRAFDVGALLASGAFKRAIRLESVGFDDGEEVDSIVLEADVAKTVLQVDGEHERRAAAFCQRHRAHTTTEAMDDLAAEFEKVSRRATRRERVRVYQRVSEWCQKQALVEDGTEPSDEDGGSRA